MSQSSLPSWLHTFASAGLAGRGCLPGTASYLADSQRLTGDLEYPEGLPIQLDHSSIPSYSFHGAHMECTTTHRPHGAVPLIVPSPSTPSYSSVRSRGASASSSHREHGGAPAVHHDACAPPVDTPAPRPYTGTHLVRCATDAHRHGRLCGPAHAAALRRPHLRGDVQALPGLASRARGHDKATWPSGTPHGARASWTGGQRDHGSVHGAPCRRALGNTTQG
jgi:hypothetical protein